MTYIPHNHYWLRGNGTVYSSALQADIPTVDERYLAWCNRGNTPTAYPKDEQGEESPAELQVVLGAYGLKAYPPMEGEEIRATIENLKDRLNELDLKTIRPREFIAQQQALKTSGEEYQNWSEEQKVIDDINAERENLRAEMHILEGELLPL